MQANTLFEQFLEISEMLTDLKNRKYEQMRGYYRRHYGKETFRDSYYEELKSEFEKILTLEDFFNSLDGISAMLFYIAECLRTAKRKREQGQPIEGIRLLIPLVPVVKNPHLCYSVDLLNYGGLGDE